MLTAEFWIEKLDLSPHPEGGYFREVYRSEDIIEKAGLPARYTESRSVATLIYYLLKNDDFSVFHRIKSDEIWIHIDGDTLDIHQIEPDGAYRKKRLGRNIGKGDSPVCIIEHGTWFGASLPGELSFCLCTCLVAPGFDFADFEMADPGKLKSSYPEHTQIIGKLSR